MCCCDAPFLETCAAAASGTPISSASARSTSLRLRRTQPEPHTQHEHQQQQQFEKKGQASGNGNGNGIDNCALHESCAGDRAAGSSEGEREARLPNPVSFRRWMHATLAMAVAENLLLLIVTYISNKENYRMPSLLSSSASALVRVPVQLALRVYVVHSFFQ